MWVRPSAYDLLMRTCTWPPRSPSRLRIALTNCLTCDAGMASATVVPAVRNDWTMSCCSLAVCMCATDGGSCGPSGVITVQSSLGHTAMLMYSSMSV